MLIAGVAGYRRTERHIIPSQLQPGDCDAAQGDTTAALPSVGRVGGGEGVEREAGEPAAGTRHSAVKAV